jgi:hypothetical protein
LSGWLLNQLDLSGFAWRTKNSLWDELNIRKRELFVKKKSAPKFRFRNCHCEGTEAIWRFSVRLPRTLQVLAMTGWEKGFDF